MSSPSRNRCADRSGCSSGHSRRASRSLITATSASGFSVSCSVNVRPVDQRHANRLEQRRADTPSACTSISSDSAGPAVDHQPPVRSAVVSGNGRSSSRPPSRPAARDSVVDDAADRTPRAPVRRRTRRRLDTRAPDTIGRWSNPRSARCMSRKLRTMRFAPTSSAKQSATCATASADCTRWPPRPSDAPRAPLPSGR